MSAPPEPDPNPVPELLVERLRLGELDPKTAAQVRARLEARGELGRLDALAADDAAWLTRHPSLPAEVHAQLRDATAQVRARGAAAAAQVRARGAAAAAQVRARGADAAAARVPGRLVSWPMLRWAPLGALVAVTMLLALRAPIGPGVVSSEGVVHGGPADGRDRIKGGATLLAWVERERPERVHDGDRVTPGERVQLAFERGEFAAATLVSIDGRGTLTEHLAPRSFGASDPSRVTLPTAFVLDEAPDFERFFLVLRAAPFGSSERAALSAAVQRLAASPHRATALLEVPDMTVVSLRLDKASTP